VRTFILLLLFISLSAICYSQDVSLSAYSYFIPQDTNYVSPTLQFDKHHLHLEARYNYEDQHTGSAWLGWNFSAGEKLSFEFTPMIGGVFGNTDGIAPGWKLSLTYEMLNLYSESEYVFDLNDSSGNFYYNWSEATLAPLDWFRFGLVVQRTKAYETELDVQRGVLVGFTVKSVDLSAYVLNFGWETPTVVLSVAAHF
jgi:hypothetical protein